MNISIATRFRPYSHELGQWVYLPFSIYALRIFPASIELHNLEHASARLECEFALNVKGPVKEFTIQSDLEKGCIRVWGESQNGFFRYRLVAHETTKLLIHIEKSTLPFFKISSSSPQWSCESIEEGKTFLFHSEKSQGGQWLFSFSSERLSLGSHRSQEWELIQRRGELSQILPLLMRMGQTIPYKTSVQEMKNEGTFSLLESCKQLIKNKKITFLYEAWQLFFNTAFKGLGMPLLSDELHQGLFLSELSSQESSSLILLQQSAQSVRTMFIQHQEEEICVLPAVPPQFHSGRFIGADVRGLGIDFEWRKKEIRRVILRVKQKASLHLNFQKSVKSYRLLNDSMKEAELCSCGTPLVVEPGQWILDRFMH